jgi:glycerol-3-phosphate dehydrogenase
MEYDLLVIGGGINGAGIARDAAGRGLRVLLCEKDDFAQGTSSRSSKLIHGGLRYLEHREFRLVREALREREVLLRAAPHLVWPLRFVLPHGEGQRPAWMIRLGLFLYDHLGGGSTLPRARRIDLRRDPAGAMLDASFRVGFSYADCWADDARLVIANLLDAEARGAAVLSRTEAVAAAREPDGWRVTLRDAAGTRDVRARVLVNAAGPWVERVLHGVVRRNAPARVRLVKGSHLVVRKFWDGPHAYILQNDDRRVVFVIPYLDDLALIGTTDVPVEDADEPAASEDERAYLLRAVNRYARAKLGRGDILDTYAGIRPLYDDQADDPSALTRDYVFDVDAPDGDGAALLSVYGGKITTYRKLAEAALDRLAPYLAKQGAPWTAGAPLPGGDMADFDAWDADFRARHPGLPGPVLRHYARLYGTRAEALLDGARDAAALGRHFGGTLYAREAEFLRRTEWARTAEDVLERRTKHGLHLDAAARAALADWMA